MSESAPNTIVTMVRDLRPWRKDQDAVVPAALAEKLIEEGHARDPRPFPPPDVAPTRPVITLKRPRGYFTRSKN